MRLVSISILALASVSMAACATTPAIAQATAVKEAAAADPLDAPAPDSMRWLYGSGEAAGASIQAYRALADYAIAMAATKPAQSVTIGMPGEDGGTSTGTVSCTAADGTAKPYAVVFDADETAILNRGIEYWTALGNTMTGSAWEAWANGGADYIAPVPGAVTGMRRLREAGITVVFNTNRDNKTAAGTAAAIEAAGLGPAVHGETLFLRGDDAMGGRKDGRRATIASRFCVLALAGDNLGDFADLFNEPGRDPQARRQLAARGELAQLWGNGWFTLPNPVYGNSIRGTIGEVFPPDARWSPPAEDAPAGQ